MSAATRLWRRAPLWRAAVLACATCAALAALFPSRALLQAIGAHGAGSTPGDLVVTPPLATTFRNRIGFAGRTLALPPGDWHQLLVGRGAEANGVAMMSLARFDAGAVTGLVVARASISPSDTPDVALRPDFCHPPDAFASSATGGDPLPPATCWVVRRTDLDPASTDRAPGVDPVAAASLDRLQASDIAAPVFHLRSAWVHTDGHEFIEATLYEPGRSGDEREMLAQATVRLRKEWSVRLARDLEADSATAAPAG